MIGKISKGKALSLLDRLNFIHILLFWFVVILAFGFFYIAFSTGPSFLSQSGQPVDNFFDAIYFSFVTATTTAFGDIVPVGFIRVIAIVEVVFGLLLLALVTSKLVSIKQDAILNEVYEISFNERLNRLRSSLLLFRQNVERVISKIEDKSFVKRDIVIVNSNLPSLRDILIEIKDLSKKDKKNSMFLRTMDSVTTELLFNSVISSLDKLDELFDLLKSKGFAHKELVHIESINDSLEIIDSLFNDLPVIIKKDTVNDLIKRKEASVERLRKKI